MGSKFSPFRLKTCPDQGGFNPVTQLQELFIFADANPHNPWPAPRREKTCPFKPQGKRFALYFHKCLPDSLKNHGIHLTDKPECEVQVLRPHPPGTGEAAAQHGKVFPDLCRKIQGNKKSGHVKLKNTFEKKRPCLCCLRILTGPGEKIQQNPMIEAAHTSRKTGRWRRLIRSPAADIIQFCLLVLLCAWFFSVSFRESGYNWQWYRVPQYIFVVNEHGLAAGPLLPGLMVTVKISAVSLVLAFGIGMITALLQLSHSFVGRITARTYLEIIRNTPLLIQLFFIYFVMGPTLGLGRFFSAVLALSLFEGAYTSEIIRAGIVSIHRGQWEAAYSLGMNNFDIYRTVVLPQTFRRTLPPLVSQAISLVKDSALVSTIAIYDLTMQAQAIIAETYLSLEIWFTVALMYLGITVTLSLLVNGLKKRFHAA